MSNSITPASESKTLAVIAGAAFAGGALYILLEDVVVKGHPWTMDHALSVLTVFGAIASGHLAGSAARVWRPVSALGFLVLFIGATALTVYSSVGRQAETTLNRTYDAEAVNKALADKGAELAKARLRLDDANRYADSERGTTCGKRCQDWTLRAREVEAHIAQLEASIATLGPQKPVLPKAANGAKILAIFGVNEDKAKAALLLIEPFANTLLFELGSIISLSYGFRSRQRIATRDSRLPVERPNLPVERRRLPLETLSANNRATDEDLVRKALSVAGRPVTNMELAALLQRSEGEASKMVTGLNGKVHKVRQGREVMISLAH